MTDADLLDILDILGEIAKIEYLTAEVGSNREVGYLKVLHMVQSYRTAVAVRIADKQGEV